MAYHYNTHVHNRQRSSRRLARFVASFILMLLLGVVVIAVDQFLNSGNSVEITGLGVQAKVESASINIFRTPYFQFQADSTWREVTDQSNEKRFVYRSYDDILVEHEFVVEVDDIMPVVLDNENTTRVVPISIVTNRLVPATRVSPHCGELLGEGQSIDQQRVTYEEATFPCDPDGASFVALISEVGGDEILEFQADGPPRTYKIRYQDSTFSPSGSPLSGIIESFQLL